MANPGVWMLAAALALLVLSGWPAWLSLVASALAFALGGLAMGALTPALFLALPARVLGLLEHDLLQALPLYVLVGCLLQRLPLAASLYRVAARLTSPALATLVLGTLLAPMNGSVGAGVALLSRLAPARGDARGVALVAAASTIGVVVPPSLVLILFGDTMMRAHTEAVNATHAAVRIVNTQDIFHGALLPALCVLFLFFAVARWQARGAQDEVVAAPERRDWLLAALCGGTILGLLGAVLLGYLYAVEAAACGAVVLLIGGLVSGALSRESLRVALADALQLSGALFALLLAATTFTLVLRAYGTDAWLAQLLQGLGSPRTAMFTVLGLLVLGAFVLDAFEITFVLAPLVLPPLLMQVPDAVWVAVLVLLVLQASFLLPPFGYALMAARAQMTVPAALAASARALLPYLAALAAVIALVLAVPQLVWHSHAVEAAPAETLTDDEVRAQFERQRAESVQYGQPEVEAEAEKAGQSDKKTAAPPRQ